ncbi:hypothetical protein [Parasphingorhabdus sp.]|uniref:hypothetical protein n=1 Tax=Parasphingorhabdus sp. TaxID=2709688 RepID=UPI003D28C47D
MVGKPHIVHTVTPAGHGSATSHASRVNGNWLSAQAQAALPRVHQEFDKSRDPLIAMQLADADKTEAQRRGEQDSGGGQSGKAIRANDNPTTQHGARRRTDKPTQTAKPPPDNPSASAPIDPELTSGAWLQKQHATAMANLPKPQVSALDQAPERGPPAPTPQLYRGPSM